ncbi:MAG: hypothetical protein CVV64_20510 [Candidatus Wallbacteria bacterium HGW-Wallbacteria-1]|jgi:uncharacterized membrane protein YsdA (DUF1294 family)|uniref:DUF1294 domain-containing protein n=1 Tax=Candidatus Wallbacteria bacterium HGW-Wallbacteria-1 TaxID=2013854 RepID=A0A2N1PI92_9BACT|nr:MAG: hypothetical protein CVV64_20510 [Candidatus Wallbacteria bacterium HGW-Wallbacteria-1]
MASKNYSKPGLDVLLERAALDSDSPERVKTSARLRNEGNGRKGRIASTDAAAADLSDDGNGQINPDAIVGGRRSRARDRRGGDRRSSSDRRFISGDRRDTPPPRPVVVETSISNGKGNGNVSDRGKSGKAWDGKSPAKGEKLRVGNGSGSRVRNPWFTYGAAAALVAGLGTFPFIFKGWHPLLAILTGINLASFLIHGMDKVLAVWSMVRVPEIVLLAMAALGGTPGAIIGQGLFRHKSSKDSFQTIFWIIAALQVALLWALFYFNIDFTAYFREGADSLVTGQ